MFDADPRHSMIEPESANDVVSNLLHFMVGDVYVYEYRKVWPLKAEPGRPRESSDRENKDQAQSVSRKRDHENEQNGAGMRGLLSPLP